MSSTSGSSSSDAPPPDDSSSSESSPSPPTKSSNSPSPKSSPPSTKNNNNNGDNNSGNRNNNGSNNGGSPSASPSSSSSGTPPTPVFSPPSRNDGSSSSPPPPKSVKSPDSSNRQDSSAAKSTGKSNSQTSSSNDDSDGGGGPDGKVIAGVAIGAGLLIMILICCIAARCTRKKKKQRFDYYPDTKVVGQYNQTGDQRNSWQNGYQNQVGDYALKVPPPPSGGGMQQHQGPTSGEMSGNFSGPYKPPMPPPSPNIALGFNKSTFSYEELSAATNGFSDANVLGQGGFGYVHKGVLPNGKEIAVKSLKTGSGQGEREFQAEVEIISRVHHRHLVSLVGYCIAGGQRMLVYEFVPNNNLEYHLHGRDRPVMDFATRLRIALGSAKGLAYLHEDCHPRIIHRDIKAANILLDFNFEAMVADFGLAKLSSDTHTHVSTRVMGTFGYLAPEYASSGKLTEKSDVFSFGVMLLELITGRRPVDPYDVMEDSLVDWARPLMSKALEDGNYDQLADPRLERVYNPQEMQRMIACAAASIRHSARKRPKMSQIVRALEGDSSLDDLNDGPKHGQGSGFGSSNNLTSGEYSESTYHADMQRFRQLALSSQEFSSEYGNSSNDSREMNLRNKF